MYVCVLLQLCFIFSVISQTHFFVANRPTQLISYTLAARFPLNLSAWCVWEEAETMGNHSHCVWFRDLIINSKTRRRKFVYLFVYAYIGNVAISVRIRDIWCISWILLDFISIIKHKISYRWAFTVFFIKTSEHFHFIAFFFCELYGSYLWGKVCQE